MSSSRFKGTFVGPGGRLRTSRDFCTMSYFFAAYADFAGLVAVCGGDDQARVASQTLHMRLHPTTGAVLYQLGPLYNMIVELGPIMTIPGMGTARPMFPYPERFKGQGKALGDVTNAEQFTNTGDTNTGGIAASSFGSGMAGASTCAYTFVDTSAGKGGGSGSASGTGGFIQCQGEPTVGVGGKEGGIAGMHGKNGSAGIGPGGKRGGKGVRSNPY